MSSSERTCWQDSIECQMEIIYWSIFCSLQLTAIASWVWLEKSGNFGNQSCRLNLTNSRNFPLES